MPKPSAILIAKMQRIEDMPEQERAVVRKFLFGGIQGINEQHDKRWRGFWGDVIKGEVGEVFDLQHTKERSGQFHKRCMGIEQTLFDRQEQWATIKALRDWLKTGAGWGDYQLNSRGVMKFVPKSRAYEECSDREMKEIHTGMLAFLRTPYAQRKLWPHLSPNARHEMLESIVEPPEQAS